MSNAESREARFRRLYLANYWELLAYSLRRVSESAAYDVVAETFLVLWRRLDDVADDEVQLWLYGVARKMVMNQSRSERRLERLRARLLALPRPRQDGEPDAVKRNEIAQVLGGLRRLAAPDRELLLLSTWEGLSNSEIASVEGCTTNAVAIRIHRARRRLEELCMKEMDVAGHKEVGLRASGTAATTRRRHEPALRRVRGPQTGESPLAGEP